MSGFPSTFAGHPLNARCPGSNTGLRGWLHVQLGWAGEAFHAEGSKVIALSAKARRCCLASGTQTRACGQVEQQSKNHQTLVLVHWPQGCAKAGRMIRSEVCRGEAGSL